MFYMSKTYLLLNFKLLKLTKESFIHSKNQMDWEQLFTHTITNQINKNTLK